MISPGPLRSTECIVVVRYRTDLDRKSRLADAEKRCCALKAHLGPELLMCQGKQNPNNRVSRTHLLCGAATIEVGSWERKGHDTASLGGDAVESPGSSVRAFGLREHKSEAKPRMRPTGS